MAENSIRREGRVKRIEYLDYLVKKRVENSKRGIWESASLAKVSRR